MIPNDCSRNRRSHTMLRRPFTSTETVQEQCVFLMLESYTKALTSIQQLDAELYIVFIQKRLIHVVDDVQKRIAHSEQCSFILRHDSKSKEGRRAERAIDEGAFSRSQHRTRKLFAADASLIASLISEDRYSRLLPLSVSSHQMY